MTLALCVASMRTLSYAASVCLREFEDDLAQLGFFSAA